MGKRPPESPSGNSNSVWQRKHALKLKMDSFSQYLPDYLDPKQLRFVILFVSEVRSLPQGHENTLGKPTKWQK